MLDISRVVTLGPMLFLDPALQKAYAVVALHPTTAALLPETTC